MKLSSFAAFGSCLCFGLADSLVFDEKITRRYYIQAEEEQWNYAPSGFNKLTGGALAEDDDAATFTVGTDKLIGPVYKKAMYFEYTDASFTTRKAKPEWLGYFGPIIRAEVGDDLEVVFSNKASYHYTIHPHGVRYNISNEGASRPDVTLQGSNVPPGSSYTYRWEVPERAGPAEADGNAVMWLYHSHYSSVADEYSGLVGPLMVYARGTLGEEGLPRDVSREYILISTVTNENLSNYLDDNCGTFGCDKEDDDFEESNLMHGINGYVYGNLPGFVTAVGERVRWFLLALGTEVDLHSMHWHGETVVHDGHRVDVIPLLPAVAQVAIMDPDQEGLFWVHCHVNDHILAGMSAIYNVTAPASAAANYRRALRGTI